MAAVSVAALVADVLIARVSLAARLVFVGITAVAGGYSIVCGEKGQYASWSAWASLSGPGTSPSTTLSSIAS